MRVVSAGSCHTCRSSDGKAKLASTMETVQGRSTANVRKLAADAIHYYQ